MASPLSGGSGSYGYYKGFPLGGEDLARVVTPLMITMAKQNGDKFQVVTFVARGTIDWPGPATDYDEAISYYTNSANANSHSRPLAGTEGSTHPEHGLVLVKREMERYLEEEDVEVKAAVTIVISDGAFTVSAVREMDTWLRQYGPVFYVFMSPDAGALSSVVTSMQTALNDWNPGLGCKNCVVDFAPDLGQGNTVTGFAGALVEMCESNAGEKVDCGSYNE